MFVDSRISHILFDRRWRRTRPELRSSRKRRVRLQRWVRSYFGWCWCRLLFLRSPSRGRRIRMGRLCFWSATFMIVTWGEAGRSSPDEDLADDRVPFIIEDDTFDDILVADDASNIFIERKKTKCPLSFVHFLLLSTELFINRNECHSDNTISVVHRTEIYCFSKHNFRTPWNYGVSLAQTQMTWLFWLLRQFAVDNHETGVSP